jgi:hypothetical protein
MANPFDQFDSQPGSSGPLVVTVAPNRKPAGNPFDQFDQPAPSTWDKVKATAADVAQALPTGIIRGAIGLAGLPGDAARIVGQGADAAAEYITGQPLPADFKANRPAASVGGERLTRDFEDLTGKLYQPQTTAGEYAQTVGEFVPGAGRSLLNQLRFGVAPAVTSETAGQLTEGTAIEGPARAVTAVVTGGLGALASRPATAQAAIAGGMRGVDDATVTAAGQLMQAAQARGVALTWPEAIAQASNGGGRGLTNLQRVVEGSQGGGDTMGNFMAQRPVQIEAAARNAFDEIAPQSQAPHTLGPAMGEAALDTVTAARGVRSAQTADAYGRAAGDTVPPEQVTALIAQLDEIIARAGTPELAGPAQQLRARLIDTPATPGTPATRTPVTDPRTGRVIRYDATPAVEGAPAIPRTNVGQLDEVYGSARDQFTGPPPIGQTGTEARAARYAGEAIGPLDDALQAASPALREGRQIHQAVTRQFIDPLLQGPIGKIAERDIGTRQVIEVLFPTNPLPGSAPEIVRSVGLLNSRNPLVARQIVRAHVESVFNEATQALQTGANQFGGAGFAAVLRGNTQQAENLAAAIQGVGGPQVLQGFDEFLNIMSATGQRQRIGSQTAFNQEAQAALTRGGAIGEAANAVATAGIKLPGRIKEAYEQWRLGRNTQQIAQLFTDPNALGLFRQLARAAPGSNQAQAISARLAVMATQTRGQVIGEGQN